VCVQHDWQQHRPAIIKRTTPFELCAIIMFFLDRHDMLAATIPVLFDSQGSHDTGAIFHIRGSVPRPYASCMHLCDPAPKHVHVCITCGGTPRWLCSLKRFWEPTHLSVEPCRM